jgi:hypothetical protein
MIDVVLLATALSAAQAVSTPQLKLDGVPLQVALDKRGKHRDIKDSDKATVPAVSWSRSRVAFLQQTGKHEWTLRILDLQ